MYRSMGVGQHLAMEVGWYELGLAIRERRQALALTQEQLAERANLHWTYISEIENARRNPSVDVLRRLASGLVMPLSELIHIAEDNSPDATT